ncbi:hypothetical protein JCGZ_22675 [Jatropha curcas]|uniref:Receptor-like serine/threonine-protein kinase n=1 Tax=Jatropha curcas TaxID=180498 RepID=A0A067JYS0_JATCU|nr:G-type lectin S-receptor-like serine/threonine-protein kinase LECRK3 [Jatropha curcas]KDP25140.1 hypothetical protein JCGZ_22675 [Jatropha curcas]
MSWILCYLFHLCPLFPLLLLTEPFLATAQSFKNISLGASLTALNDNSSWSSPSGEFAFGFQQIETDGFLLAIWFDKIPQKTIAWSANRNNLVQRGSEIKLTEDGRLVLNDPKGKRIWNADTAGRRPAYAAMLNDGNFVLAYDGTENLWESFGEPTDTILPTQTLTQGNKLISHYSSTNYSTGRFLFTLQSDGDLKLYTTYFPLASPNFGYWSSETVNSGFQVIFNQSGEIYLEAKNKSILVMLSASVPSTQDFYHRAILEYDGVFRHYVYPKDPSLRVAGGPMRWSPVSFTPVNICLKIREEKGSGACGFNSYCVLDDDHRPNCRCPQGYTFLDPDDVMKGCKQDFVSQNCEEASLEVDLFYMEVKENTDWPLSDYEYFRIVTEDWCRKACLSDCFCAVAIFRDGECWKKKIPLSNGRFDSTDGGKALIKVRRDNSTLKPDDENSSRNKNHSTLIIIGSLLLSSSLSLNFLLLLGALLAVFCFGYGKAKKLQLEGTMQGINLQSFTYNELEKATDKFKEEIGRGAFATVYKGVLGFDNALLVAVKKLHNMVGENDKEFKAEVRAIGRTNHKNLVHLIGFCNEEEHRLLVYEFVRNGNLANFLFGNSRPHWYKRKQIAFGIARGLFYLHEECSTQIIHCDIKPQNILLDDSFTARISDFGIAKLLMTDQTRTTTAIRGTRGYVAPEWFKNLPVTAKFDVYSFGILLLELTCCRKNFEAEVEDENQMVLADWAYDCYKGGELYLLIQNDEEAKQDIKRVEKFVMIAIWCIQEDPSLRPAMKKVTQMLEGTVEVSVPPDPSSFMSSIGSL